MQESDHCRLPLIFDYSVIKLVSLAKSTRKVLHVIITAAPSLCQLPIN